MSKYSTVLFAFIVGLSLTSTNIVYAQKVLRSFDELSRRGKRDSVVMVGDLNRGGLFVYSATSQKADNGIVFAASGGGVWIRQYEDGIKPEWFGAKADGTSDDKPAVQAAVNYALSRPGVGRVKFTGNVYRLNSNVSVDLGPGRTNRGIVISGSNSKIFCAGGGFVCVAANQGQQDSKVTFEDLYFYGDNNHRVNAITQTFIDFFTVKDCKFDNVAAAVSMSYCGMGLVTNCFFWGCEYGVKLLQMRDTKISLSHAYHCKWGYYLEGSPKGSIFETSGGVTVDQCTANASDVSNMFLQRLYAPVITGAQLEQSPNNLTIRSCQYGTWTGGFIGPATSNANGAYSILVDDAAGFSNDFWNINGMIAQGRVRFNAARQWQINNFVLLNGHKDNASDNANLTMFNCNEMKFLNAEIGGASSYTIKIEENTAGTYISNSHLNGPLLINGAPNRRFGRTSVRASTIGGGVVSSGAKANETFEYTDNFGGKDYILISPFNMKQK
jgi:hypothetical protein